MHREQQNAFGSARGATAARANTVNTSQSTKATFVAPISGFKFRHFFEKEGV
jgi:hypothetical protein